MDGSIVDIVDPSDLPAHSPLGASGAERWMNCPGSITLIELLRSSGDGHQDDPDYRRDGTQAHALAAHCLEQGLDCWEVEAAHFPDLNAEMMGAVQTYLDFVRELPGKHFVETRVYRPEFHECFYGTMDFAAVNLEEGYVHFVDYKHGVGVLVEVEDNPQLMYYAYGFIAEDHGTYPDDMPLAISIVQPRGFHPKGAIRTWRTTASHIRQWAAEQLHPAMEATADLEYLAMGEWCRFCPAKTVCPAFAGLAAKALNKIELTYQECRQLKMLVAARLKEIEQQLVDGADPQELGAKLVEKRADRVWKDDAQPVLVEKLGEDAWQEPKLRSPAQVEKLVGGKALVAEWAYKPDAGYSVAAIDDKRAQYKPKTPEEKYANALKWA